MCHTNCIWQQIRWVCLIIMSLVFSYQGHAQHRHSNSVDNVLEYMPYASIFALKACGVESRDNWRELTMTTAEATWWITRIIFKSNKEQVLVGFSGNTLDVAVTF